MVKKLSIFFLLLSSQYISSTIRVVCTAALVENHFEYRKKQYIEAFNILKSYGYHDCYVIEALKKHGPTFLEDFSKNVFYSTVNNPHLRNNGINEAKTMLEGCIHFNFHPDDIIIKITGRYHLMSDFLLKVVENNPDFDAYVKVNEDQNVFTVGFAMRYKYLKEMFENIDYDVIERGMIPIEYRVGDYIKKKKKQGSFKVMYLEKLYIKGNAFGSSTAPGAPDLMGYH